MQTPGVKRVPRLGRETNPALTALAVGNVGFDFTRERVVLNDGPAVILLLDALGSGGEDVTGISTSRVRGDFLLRLLDDCLLLRRTMTPPSEREQTTPNVKAHLSERSLPPLQCLRCSTQFFMMNLRDGLRSIHSLHALQNAR